MIIGPNTTISSRYRIESLIATGGMGQVWLARDTVLERDVAIKILKEEFSQDPNFLGRFRVEARTTARLNHPNIVSVYDYGEFSDSSGSGHPIAYLVMELVHAESLSHALGRLRKLTVAQALDMLSQTGQGLSAAHEEGIVHRDIKPANILITPRGRVKISDFGIAKAVDAVPITRTGTVMGTAQYISPEQALGKEATPASDVYSLGIVGYEALCGSRPFTGEGSVTAAMQHVTQLPAALPKDIPDNVRHLIAIALRKDPQQRYADGADFARAVSQVQAGNPAPLPLALTTLTPEEYEQLPPDLREAVKQSAVVQNASSPSPALHRQHYAVRPGSGMSGVEGVAGAAGAMGVAGVPSSVSSSRTTTAINNHNRMVDQQDHRMVAPQDHHMVSQHDRALPQNMHPGAESSRRRSSTGSIVAKVLAIILLIILTIATIAYIAYSVMAHTDFPSSNDTQSIITHTHTTTVSRESTVEPRLRERRVDVTEERPNRPVTPGTDKKKSKKPVTTVTVTETYTGDPSVDPSDNSDQPQPPVPSEDGHSPDADDAVELVSSEIPAPDSVSSSISRPTRTTSGASTTTAPTRSTRTR